MKNKLNTSLSLRKVLLSALVAAPLATLPAPLWALPVNPQHPSWNPAAPNVTFPSTTSFVQAGNVLQITDTLTNRLVLNWVEFGAGASQIGSTETVIWTLPGTSSAVLNTVSGTSPTVVNGMLQSNGSIFIVNPNGITLTSTSKVSAAGLGLSTSAASANDFTFAGTLGTAGLSAANGDIIVASALDGTTRGINVGSTGNVMLAGRRVEVSGDINAGTLTINSNNVAGVTAPGVVLASSSALTVGTAGVAATGTADVVRGTGAVEINSNGGAVSLSTTTSTTIRGGQLTVNTAGGAIGQGTGAVSIGDGLGDSTQTLTINAGAGAVTLPNLDVTGSGNNRRLDITVTAAGNTRLAVNDDVRLMSSTINGSLSLTSKDEDIQSGGASTVTGTVQLAVPTGDKDITFNSVGDLNFGVNTISTTSITVPTAFPAATTFAVAAGLTLPVGSIVRVTSATDSTVFMVGTVTSYNATTGALVVSVTGSGFTGAAPTVANWAIGVDAGLIAHPSHAGSDITLTSGGSIVLPSILLGGNLTVTAATNITQQASSAILQPTTNRRAKFEATAGGITLDNAGNDFTRVQLVGAPGGVTLRDLDDVTIFNGTNVSGNATINANSIILGASASDTVTFNGNLTLNAGAAGATPTVTIVSQGTGYTAAPTFTFSTGGGGTTTLSVTTGTTSVPVTTPGTGYVTPPAVTFAAPTTGTTAAGTAILAVNDVAITAGGTGYTTADTFAVQQGGATTAILHPIVTGGVITGWTFESRGSGFTDLSTATISPVGTTAGTGATFGAITGQIAAINVTTGGTGYGTTPVPTVAAPTAGVTAVLDRATGQVTAATVTTQPTTFAAAPTVIFSSGTASATAAATVPAGAGVTDNSNNVTVTGITQINTLGVVTIDGGAAGSAIGLNHNFGVINVNQGGSTAADPGTGASVTLYEATTLNLGAITTGGKLRAYSSGGDVIDTGPIVSVGAEFGAGTAAAPGNITIDSAGTNITGTIAILDDVAVVTNSPANGGPVIGTYLANNVSITTVGSITLAGILSTTDVGLPGTLTLNVTGAGNDIVFAAPVAVAGVATLTAADAITATGDNMLNTVTVTAGGNVNIENDQAMTINATLTQNAAGNTARFDADGQLAIGSFNADYTGGVTFRTRGGNDIVDNVNGMRVFGPVTFSSNRHVTINNTGHSFGLVSAESRNNNGNITIVESGGLRLGTVATHGRGNFTATSTTGDIFQDDDLGGIRLGNGETGAGTFSAPMGSVLLTDNDRTGNVNSIAITTITAGGNVILNNPRVGQLGQVVLGNITAGGSLTVDSSSTHTSPGVQTVTTVSAATTNNIEQTSAGRINAFGLVTLVSGGGAITLGNSGNRLGGVIASSGAGNITITESTTLNLLSIATTGTLVATSETGSIIDTAFATPAPFVNVISAPTALFSAPNGNVTLGLTSSNFATVGFTTGGNVSVIDSVGNITLAASTIGGTFDVTNNALDGSINQSGALAVAGNVTLTTRDDPTTVGTGGGIDLGNMANMFGGIRFTAGVSGVRIAENTTLNLRGGSTSTGPVFLATNGDFITSGAGASSITNDLTIQAQGTIIPGAGSLLVTGVFIVFSPSLKDLSALSKSGNLLNRDPVNQGTGPYTPPSP